MPPLVRLWTSILLCMYLLSSQSVVLSNRAQDKFTTNFYLPDDSYGALYSGSYTFKNGDTANFISGNYTSGGKSGNLYAGSNASKKPNAATLPIPSQWTSSGVGSAIPATALGIGVTIYTIIGPTTIPPLTIQPTTIPAKTISGSIIPARTISGTTVAAQTFTGTTTLIRTSTLPSVDEVSASATAKKKNIANVFRIDKGLQVVLVTITILFV
jgi:hypothetical protein